MRRCPVPGHLRGISCVAHSILAKVYLALALGQAVGVQLLQGLRRLCTHQPASAFPACSCLWGASGCLELRCSGIVCTLLPPADSLAGAQTSLLLLEQSCRTSLFCGVVSGHQARFSPMLWLLASCRAHCSLGWPLLHCGYLGEQQQPWQ